MTLNELASRITFANTDKGFEFTEEELDQKLLLAVSEICEAQEELRDGHKVREIYYLEDAQGLKKPCGFPVELADALIRLLHIGGRMGIDLDAVVETKLAYNAKRPMKHGRKF